EPRGRLLAFRALASKPGVRARLDHGRKRAVQWGPGIGRVRRRAVVRARPRQAVPDGAAAAPRRLRPRRCLGGEAVPRPRGRVPPQGADAARCLGARVSRHAAPGGPALLRGARLAPPAPLCEWPAAPRSARIERGPGRRGLDLQGCAPRPARLAGPGRGGPASAADSRSGARLLLPSRDLGDDCGARAVRPLRPATAVGADRGHAVNRALDVAGASLGLALASPLLAVAALAIKLVDR